MQVVPPGVAGLQPVVVNVAPGVDDERRVGHGHQNGVGGHVRRCRHYNLIVLEMECRRHRPGKACYHLVCGAAETRSAQPFCCNV